MGWLLIWIVLIGLPVVLACGFAYARYLKHSKSKDTPSQQDGT